MRTQIIILIVGILVVVPLVIHFRDRISLKFALGLLAGLALAFFVRMGSNKARDLKDKYGI